MKMKKMELYGVARAFVQISENGQQSKKFGHPWHRLYELFKFVSFLDFWSSESFD